MLTQKNARIYKEGVLSIATAGTIIKQRKLLEESYSLIERLRKLRALNANPRLVGMNPRLQRALEKK